MRRNSQPLIFQALLQFNRLHSSLLEARAPCSMAAALSLQEDILALVKKHGDTCLPEDLLARLAEEARLLAVREQIRYESSVLGKYQNNSAGWLSKRARKIRCKRHETSAPSIILPMHKLQQHHHQCLAACCLPPGLGLGCRGGVCCMHRDFAPSAVLRTTAVFVAEPVMRLQAI